MISRQHDSSILIFLCFLFLIPAHAMNAAPRACDTSALRATLDSLLAYDVENESTGDLRSWTRSSMQTLRLMPYVDSVLDRLLPHTRFFRATFQTSFFEYPTVEALVATRCDSGPDDLQVLFALDFTGTNMSFFSPFLDVAFTSTEDLTHLAHAIGRMLSSMTLPATFGSRHGTYRLDKHDGEVMILTIGEENVTVPRGVFELHATATGNSWRLKTFVEKQ